RRGAGQRGQGERGDGERRRDRCERAPHFLPLGVTKRILVGQCLRSSSTVRLPCLPLKRLMPLEATTFLPRIACRPMLTGRLTLNLTVRRTFPPAVSAGLEASIE